MTLQPPFGAPFYSQYSRYGYRYPTFSSARVPENSPISKKVEPKKNFQKSYSNPIQRHSKSSYTEPFKPISKPCPSKEKEEIKNENRTSPKEDSPIFEIFGISLYFDDILLICLIFFLYEEGVKDTGLFISLILLLLS